MFPVIYDLKSIALETVQDNFAIKLLDPKNLKEMRPELTEHTNPEYPGPFRKASKPHDQLLREAGHCALLTGQYLALLKEKWAPEKLTQAENKLELTRKMKYNLADAVRSNKFHYFVASFSSNDENKKAEVAQLLKEKTFGYFKSDNRIFSSYLQDDADSIKPILDGMTQVSHISQDLYLFKYNAKYSETLREEISENSNKSANNNSERKQ